MSIDWLEYMERRLNKAFRREGGGRTKSLSNDNSTEISIHTRVPRFQEAASAVPCVVRELPHAKGLRAGLRIGAINSAEHPQAHLEANRMGGLPHRFNNGVKGRPGLHWDHWAHIIPADKIDEQKQVGHENAHPAHTASLG